MADLWILAVVMLVFLLAGQWICFLGFGGLQAQAPSETGGRKGNLHLIAHPAWMEQTQRF